MPNRYKIIVGLMLSALATPLVACQDAQGLAPPAGAAQAQGDRTRTLLPGETDGCGGGDECDGKPDIDE